MANELKDFIGILFKEESSSSDYILPVCKCKFFVQNNVLVNSIFRSVRPEEFNQHVPIWGAIFKLNLETWFSFISAIESKEVTLLQLIEELKPFLLHKEVLIRRKAVLVVAQILERSNFNEKENDLLTEFFCSKLEDHHSILPAALQGIFALVFLSYSIFLSSEC